MGLNKRLIDQAGAAGVGATDNFAPVAYTGNGGTQSISSLDFQPDLVWIKGRSSGWPHRLQDSARGATKYLNSATTGGETTSANTVTSFDTNGFTLGADGNVNAGYGHTYVAWCWKAAGAAVSNTDGTITSQVSANQDAGFSIVKYTKTAGNTTVGHGLSQKPDIIFSKATNSTGNWLVFTDITGTHGYLHLNLTNTFTAYASSPNASTFNSFYDTGNEVVNYCFHSVDGYQKFGTYTGTGQVSGPTINLGFQPRFFMVKQIDPAYGNKDWYVWDSARGGFDDNSKILQPNTSNAEDSGTYNVDFTSTGVFFDTSPWTDINQNGATYLYWAIA
jgi:hypothetical protein